ncbi:MAG TPA: CRTAC1 family protein [Verrucomicrobiae bacterium]|nr:CRTAC1 family protein [Verrucomicrobiae bacterium]
MPKLRIIALLLCLLASALLCWRWPRAGSLATPQAPARFTSAASPADPRVVQQFLALEARENDLDRTLWTNEILALQHERVFIDLWDRLRHGTNALATLGDFRFEELRLGKAGDPSVVDADEISIARVENSSLSLTPAQWRERLAAWNAAGWDLEHSEWRHSQFDRPGVNPARSLFDIALYGTNRLSPSRFIVRGQILVEWREGSDVTSLPFPRVIMATNLEILTRAGEAPFETGPPRDITPVGQFHDQPVLVHDLDGDGRAEIILPARNEVLWNAGDFRFRAEQLFSTPLDFVTAAVIADFTGDGRADMLCANRGSLLLFSGQAGGHFDQTSQRVPMPDAPLANPFVLAAGDVNGDGALDVWLGQYKPPAVGGQMPVPFHDANDGFPGHLLQNDGHGHFKDATTGSGLEAKRHRRTYSASFIDLDDDGDLDLLVASDFAGIDIYLNDGRGHFTDVTTTRIDEPHLFGMAHTFNDFNRDGRLDLFVTGMDSAAADRLGHWNLFPPGRAEDQRNRALLTQGNRLYFGRDGGFAQSAISAQVARSGWSWGVSAPDWNNDGFPDLMIANGHLSRESVADYDSQFWRHDIYAGNSREDRAVEMYFGAAIARHQDAGGSYGGHQFNRFFINHGGREFREVGYLLGVALEADSRSVVAEDFDNDGRVDLLVSSFSAWPKPFQGLHLYRNTGSVGGGNSGNNWIGFHLKESAPGCSPIGAKITLRSAHGTQTRWLVTGDSYLCQHATSAHFGLGEEASVEEVEIRWPTGKRQAIGRPAINQYHEVVPKQ